jgi:hypothetical protein
MNDTIKLKRLQDIIVKGNFSINCDNNDEVTMLHNFFFTLNNYIKFKDISNISKENINVVEIDTNNKTFIIKYESLAELLKLREIFRIRASKFDMRLIKKRKYNMFTDEFYTLCENTNIQKIRK